PALTGNKRQITITNNGDVSATGLSISYPIWPSGTSSATSCGSTLAANASCTISITPGDTATSGCSTTAKGKAPTPGTITVSATNASIAVTSKVVVLDYGCQYQGGFLYSVDDTTNNGVKGTCSSSPCTGSIGGKVASLVDQASNALGSTDSIPWSANVANGTPDFTVILGVDDKSTALNPSPIVPTYPVQTPAFKPCNGSSDGACNTSNIISFFNYNNHGVGGIPPTPLTSYAAGLCKATINGYKDWYLPAICEIDFGFGSCSTEASQSMATNLEFLIGDPQSTSPLPRKSCQPPSNTDCLAGYYWSSTEYFYTPDNTAWYELFDSTIGGNMAAPLTDNDKDFQASVRFTRALIP
ncbi:MAG: hypothetical protein PSV35_08550, partial [bacterium]|nr:hypothetical protein [bacterium]